MRSEKEIEARIKALYEDPEAELIPGERSGLEWVLEGLPVAVCVTCSHAKKRCLTCQSLPTAYDELVLGGVKPSEWEQAKKNAEDERYITNKRLKAVTVYLEEFLDGKHSEIDLDALRDAHLVLSRL